MLDSLRKVNKTYPLLTTKARAVALRSRTGRAGGD